MKTKILFWLCLFMQITLFAQQDFQFLQYWNAPQQLNPALTGLIPDGKFRLNSNHNADFQYDERFAHQLAFDTKIPVFAKDYIGIGTDVILNYDLGNTKPSLRNFQTMLSAAYIKGIGKRRTLSHFLSLGANIYYGKRRTWDFYDDYSIPWGDLWSPIYLNYHHRLDVDLGVNWTTLQGRRKQNLYSIGFSIGHLNQSTHPFSIPDGYTGVFPGLRYNLHAASNTQLSPKWFLQSNVLWSVQRRHEFGGYYSNNIQLSPQATYRFNRVKNYKLIFGLGGQLQFASLPNYFYRDNGFSILSQLGITLNEVSLLAMHRYFFSSSRYASNIYGHSFELGLKYERKQKNVLTVPVF